MWVVRPPEQLSLGTTPLIRVPKEGPALTARPGDAYFVIGVHAAQASAYGRFWERARQLVVTTEVTVNAPPFHAEPITSIHRIRPIAFGKPEQLGLGATLVDLVPATMDRVSVVVEYLLDSENRLALLTDIANEAALTAVASAAPGAAAVTKIVGGLSKRFVQQLAEKDRREPILRFVGDFSVAGGELADAYYVILGTRSDKYPLPRPLPQAPALRVSGSDLLYEGRPVLDWSYVVIAVDAVERRTRALGRGEEWYRKLDEAEVVAREAARDIFAERAKRRQAWEACLLLLADADRLLHASPLYLPKEADAIIQAATHAVKETLFPPNETALGAPPLLSDVARALARVNSEEELAAAAVEYGAAEQRSLAQLERLGMVA
jgi:hypothetical protein